jgi:hypothetical protein
MLGSHIRTSVICDQTAQIDTHSVEWQSREDDFSKHTALGFELYRRQIVENIKSRVIFDSVIKMQRI